jgi:8-amino-3,8-dideoxy-alpha-D-manno-octulosonate transaminase
MAGVGTERLALDGGTPVRTTPLPTGFFGTRLIGDEERAEVLAVLEARALSRVSGMTPPTRVAAFERELCRRLGCRYSLAVTSGTAALEVALAAAGIGPGDEVIMPALNFISSPETALRLGAVPVFAEVDEGFGLDPEDVEPRITARTCAIMPVHVHGAACRIDAIVTVARRHGLRVIENGAWSLGARFHGQSIGTFGDLGAHSLQSVKVITSGEGGVVLTGDPILYERAARYHNHGNLHLPRIPQSLAEEPASPEAGQDPAVEPFIGAAFRMNELTGAVALAQVRKLDAVLDRTRRAQHAILDGLRAVLGEVGNASAPFALRDVPDPEGDCGIAVGLLLPSAEQATGWQAALGAEGIRLGPLYGGRPVYALPQLRDLRPVWTNGAPAAGGRAQPYVGSLCPRTEDLLARSLVLSVTPDYTDQDAQDVVRAVRKVAAALR